jgi:hypothetical protein
MAATRLALAAFKNAGVFARAAKKWHDKPAVQHALPLFKIHFNFENKERLRKLTAQTAGFHGANQAIAPPTTAAAAAAPAAPSARSKRAAATPVALVKRQSTRAQPVPILAHDTRLKQLFPTCLAATDRCAPTTAHDDLATKRMILEEDLWTIQNRSV